MDSFPLFRPGAFAALHCSLSHRLVRWVGRTPAALPRRAPSTSHARLHVSMAVSCSASTQLSLDAPRLHVVSARRCSSVAMTSMSTSYTSSFPFPTVPFSGLTPNPLKGTSGTVSPIPCVRTRYWIDGSNVDRCPRRSLDGPPRDMAKLSSTDGRIVARASRHVITDVRDGRTWIRFARHAEPARRRRKEGRTSRMHVLHLRKHHLSKRARRRRKVEAKVRTCTQEIPTVSRKVSGWVAFPCEFSDGSIHENETC